MKYTTENDIEAYHLEVLQLLGYEYKNGRDIAPDGSAPERQRFSDVLLVDRLSRAIDRLNPHIPSEARRSGQRELQNVASSDLLNDNEIVHRHLCRFYPTFRTQTVT